MNSQEAEGDVDVAVVAPVAVDVGEPTVVGVAYDERILGTIALTFRFQICPTPSMTPDLSSPDESCRRRWRPLFGDGRTRAGQAVRITLQARLVVRSGTVVTEFNSRP